MNETFRFVWCQTTLERLHGRVERKLIDQPNWWQRLLKIKYEQGAIFAFDTINRAAAQLAFNTYVNSPKAFSVCTRDGGRVDMHITSDRHHVWLDLWFFENDIDNEISDCTVPVSEATNLIDLIYEDQSDEVILSNIKRMATVLTEKGKHT